MARTDDETRVHTRVAEEQESEEGIGDGSRWGPQAGVAGEEENFGNIVHRDTWSC